ncbi:type II toxin-antitoxin system HigB family toxin [Brevundimonas aveniformis]|uniref:type II toxin-antitoxin system HigB family toxin n=1 Tax=Brevundimonas aveniformis TaxID=370977 RepID=UPI0024931B0B|nr:type II toxin-antitoxin system HigB family toxin [Brevundimonas aveniformis]
MNVIAKRTLQAFWLVHPTAKAPLAAWYSHAKAADWKTPQDIRDDFRSADFVADNRVIFNIGGGNYRLVVHVAYAFKAVLIKFVGTHREYDKIDPATV